MRIPSHPRHSGFVTVAAIILLAIIGMLLTVHGSNLTSRYRQTKNDSKGTQLRQMLMAGAAQASEMVEQELQPREPVQLDLPESLTALHGQVTIHFQPVSDPLVRQVEVRAELDDLSSRQTLRFMLHDGFWFIHQVDLPETQDLADSPT